MTAIWHDSGLPSFLGAPPRFSFQDIAEIVQPAPATYEAARYKYIKWERKMGAAYFRHNAYLAHQFYMAKRAWWLSL